MNAVVSFEALRGPIPLEGKGTKWVLQLLGVAHNTTKQKAQHNQLSVLNS